MSVFTAKMNSNGTLTVVIDGKVMTADCSHFNYSKLYQAYKDNNADEFGDLFNTINNVSSTISSNSGGKVELIDEVIHYNGIPLHNEMTKRMINILKEGEDINYLLLFIESLMKNPSKRAVDELYTFLSHKNLPITEDGHFLAYKCVRENYLDKHSGKFDNRPGAICEMPRNAVDDDKDRTCSYGFHAGSLEYSGPNGSFWSNSDKVIIVKINPADVVSIPSDCNGQKLRTCRYEVVADYQAPLTKSVYSGAGVNDENYNNDYAYNDEVADDDVYLDVDDLCEGDLIEFDYEKDGNVERRHGEVEELNWNSDVVNIRLAPPEDNSGEYRNFRLAKMDNVLLKN